MPNNKLYTFRELLSTGITDIPSSQVTPLHSIFIPTIQRPYAQGRPSAADIRSNFVRDLFKALRNPEVPYELNFVFGTLTQERSGNSFELLDGQQRLTTLMLLHWYLAMRSEADAGPSLSLLSKFSYQTRTTSVLFLTKLFKRPVSIDALPSEILMRQPWYTTAFSKDSTVTGMMVMLDEIHARYEREREEGFCPTYENLDTLKFYLQELKGFGISDDLFIKMNARGLQLTPFENFKAELIGWLKHNPFKDGRYDTTVRFGESAMPFWLAFSSKIDTVWTDIFWKPAHIEDSSNLGAANADKGFFTFIKRWLANRALTLAVETGDSDFDRFHTYFSNKSTVNKYSSFDGLREFLEKANSSGVDIIKELTRLLDVFSEQTGKMLDAFRAPWQTACQLPMDEKFDLRPMIIFSAISEFIAFSKSNFDSVEFRHWMRIVHNVVQNQDINSASRQQTLTKQLKRAIDFDSSLPIYERFKAFNQNQRNREFNAEVMKIDRILADAKWEEAFIEAERNPFMTGSVTFYLDGQTDLRTYKTRTPRVDYIFNSDGVRGEFARKYLLVRAIVAVDSSLFDPNRDFINFTNKESANRYLKNLTIWNDTPAIGRLWRDLLDMPSADDMIAELNRLVETPSSPEGIAQNNPLLQTTFNLGISRFCSDKGAKPIEWLENAISSADRQLRYNKDNGIVYFYKGPVNCMYLNNHREEFIPRLINALESLGFVIKYWDQRQPAAYERYKLYSGDRLWIKASREDLSMAFRFDWNFVLHVYLQSEQPLDNYREDIAPALPEGVQKKTPDSNHTTVWGHDLFYRILKVPDIRDVDPAALANCVSAIERPALSDQ